MAEFVGADVEQLEALSRRLEIAAKRLESLTASASLAIMAAAWVGGDIDDLRSRWNRRTKPALSAAGRSLDGLSKQLDGQASQQRDASGPASGLAPGVWVLAAGSATAGAAAAIRSLSGGSSTVEVGEDGVTLESGVSGQVGIGASTSGSFSNGAVSGSSSADVFVGTKGAANSSLKVGPDGLSVHAGASGSVGASAHARGQVGLGGVASASGQADAFAGARASADATATIGPDGLSAKAGFGGFAGAEASASGKVAVGGAAAGGSASVYAGIGVKANAEASITPEKVAVSLDLGVAIGVGAGIKVDVSFSPTEAAKTIGALFGFHS